MVLCGVIAFRHWKEAPSQTPVAESDLEELKALPYVQWSSEKTSSAQTGITLHDSALAYDGYNLYTNDVDRVYLMDMSGRKVHEWKVPGARKNCEYAEPVGNGEIVVVCVSQALIKLDWDSNVIWERKLRVHHDVEQLPDGTLLTVMREIAMKYNTYDVIFDTVLHLDSNGKPINRWSTFENLSSLRRFHKASALDTPGTKQQDGKFDYYHTNTVQALPETPLASRGSPFLPGNLLLCLRNADLLLILHKDTRRIVWSWGAGELQWPHMPTMLPSGNILVFDNGIRRKASRVLEVNPVTKKIVWKYEAHQSFFSPFQGSAQRLPNGNTLICESNMGRAFEVTADHRIVWEFWNPEVRDDKKKTIYRLLRYSKELFKLYP